MPSAPKKSKEQHGRPDASTATGEPESTGGPGVSTGPPEVLKLYFGDNDAQFLSDLLCQMEESITEVHGFSYSHRDRRRALIMTLPTSEGWQVMKRLLQAGTGYASMQEVHDRFELLVEKRWTCLKAGNVTHWGGPGPF